MRKLKIFYLSAAITIAACGLLGGCRQAATGVDVAAPGGQAAPGLPAVGLRVPVIGPGSGLRVPMEPDLAITPGAVLPVSTADVCTPGYSEKVRDVPEKVKRQAYAEYGITRRRPREFEVDHLISLELGGSNSLKNLWPESYLSHPWNAHIKDQLENALHDDVCSGRVALPVAQKEIAMDWIAAYKREFHTNVALASVRGRYRGRPAADSGGDFLKETALNSAGASSAPAYPASAPAAGDQVWVNLRSGKYFRPGSEYYGRTKEGRYMSEAEARSQDYVAAR